MRAHRQIGGGPSPRARGRRAHINPKEPIMGSIPAGAGETAQNLLKLAIVGVHPRGRGGDVSSAHLFSRRTGPSPRARGRRVAALNPATSWGSIPAGAGETRFDGTYREKGKVHPRGRGGDAQHQVFQILSLGPSPRARGRQEVQAWAARKRWSIPAGAGETLWSNRLIVLQFVTEHK